VHDLQMAVSGEAARALADLTGRRWAKAGGDELASCDGVAALWPASAPPWLENVQVGIARTRAGKRAVAEVAQLNAAALAAARRCVYMEAQYFSAAPVVDRLAEMLKRGAGPEIVVLIWREARGWLERFAMGSNRDRALRRLAQADVHGRFRAYWRRVAGRSEQEVKLHSKLIVVDDVFVRIGSSNLNNRSLGFDTECDLAIEAADRITRNAIADLRADLLAEHLRCSPDDVRRHIDESGLIDAIESLKASGGLLQPYGIEPDTGATEPLAGTEVLDPAEPLDLDYLTRALRDRFFTE
jgi:phosphatidylserine/phosphatidylglycerophosphate/cardiolipin synthase-like enzyme